MARKSKGRTSRNRPLPKRVLILCEGQTEVFYFKSYTAQKNKRRKLSGVSVKVFQPKKYTPIELLQEAKRKIREERNGIPYDAVWIVFDKDEHLQIRETFKQAKAAGVFIAYSAICFEFWVLLHFHYSARSFSTCEQVIQTVRQKEFSTYKKAKEDLFHDLKDRIPTAIQNAEKVKASHGLKTDETSCECTPYTDVYLLVQYLDKICES